ncbi:MAG: thiamine phosphate synthase [Methylococcales bacterium]|nr:thiamine phosphate synthase [Methylococcales bacterium]
MLMPKRGLYAITPDGKTAAEILKFTEAVLKGGACVVQYREKSLNDVSNLAKNLLKLCHSYNVPLIINDNVELAERIEADGVHLGKNDGSVLNARKRLGESAIIGVSCYNLLERAIEAEKQGANYVAFGRFFTSNSKPFAAPAEIGTLTAAKRVLALPIVAIGGILPENGASLLNAGADLLAVIGGLVTADSERAAQNYDALFSQGDY